MKYTIDKKAAKPIYLQLYEQLRADIVGGSYLYGDRLPSKRLLGQELGISTVSAEHAYALLEDEGYAEARERSGFFAAYSHTEYYASPQKEAPAPPISAEAVKLEDLTEPLPFSVYARTARGILAQFGEALLLKSPNRGLRVLRQAIASYLSRNRGISVRTDRIIIGSGAEYLYGLVIQLLGRERIYAIESPSYEKIETVYRANEVSYELLPLGTDGIDRAALAGSCATVLHITPYRSFPSGVTASAGKRREYLRFADKNGGYIIEDDFASEFTLSTKSEETVFARAERDNVIYINTFSKTVAPSLRVGYMVLPEQLLPVFEEKCGAFSCTVPTFEQYLLTRLLTDGDFERHINRVRRKKRKSQ